MKKFLFIILFLGFVSYTEISAQDSSNEKPAPEVIDNTNYYIIGLTAVIAGGTIFYAIKTSSTVSAIKENNQVQFLPHIVATLSNMGPVALALEIANIGKGGAKELHVNYTVLEIPSIQKQWFQKLLRPEASQVFYLEDSQGNTVFSIDYFKQNQYTLQIEWNCIDVFGTAHSGTDELDITNFVTQYSNIHAQYKEEPIDNISRRFDNVQRSLSSMERSFSKLERETENTRHKETVDYQIKLYKKRLTAKRLDKKKKSQIDFLLDEISIRLREDHFPSDEKIIVEHLEQIKSIDNKTFDEIISTVINLNYIRGVRELFAKDESN